MYLVIISQLEMKQKLDEYKRQKEEYMKMVELERLARERAERDMRVRSANAEITNFQQRVSIIFKDYLNP